MKSISLILNCVLIAQLTFGQAPPPEYSELVKKAFSLYETKEYKASASTYSDAFKANGWVGLIDDRYNAACSWALAGYPDSAFNNLNRIASKGNYANYDHIIIDSDLNSLHSDKRWQPLLDQIKFNKDKAEANLNKPLVHQLDSIYVADQKYRMMFDSVEKTYGDESKEMQDLGRIMHEKDSINLIKVKTILDKYGWLGADSIGEQGNTILFLVIQHADLKTQEKYLPMMKEAAKNKKLPTSSLALLIDRIEMRNGRPQIYGSQVSLKDGKYAPYLIIDEVNVNKRRAEVGLEPLEVYLKRFNIDYTLPTK